MPEDKPYMTIQSNVTMSLMGGTSSKDQLLKEARHRLEISMNLHAAASTSPERDVAKFLVMSLKNFIGSLEAQ